MFLQHVPLFECICVYVFDFHNSKCDVGGGKTDKLKGNLGRGLSSSNGMCAWRIETLHKENK